MDSFINILDSAPCKMCAYGELCEDAWSSEDTFNPLSEQGQEALGQGTSRTWLRDVSEAVEDNSSDFPLHHVCAWSNLSFQFLISHSFLKSYIVPFIDPGSVRAMNQGKTNFLVLTLWKQQFLLVWVLAVLLKEKTWNLKMWLVYWTMMD